MIKKLKEAQFVFDREELSTPLEIHQLGVTDRLTAKSKVYLTKKEAKGLYTFLKKVFK